MSTLLPKPILRGAGRWLQLLQRIDRDRAWDQLRRGDYQDLTPTQYAVAFDWLVEARILDEGGRPQSGGPTSLAEQALEAAIERARPAWLVDERALSDPTDLPADLVEAAESLAVPIEDASRLAAAHAGKVNTERRAQIGALGEKLLVDLLKRSTPYSIVHVALHSDHWGFDVRIDTGDRYMPIEVKTTTPGPRTEFFLSRHELEVALHEPQWRLVLVTLRSEQAIGALAVVDRDWLLTGVPNDRPPFSRWESARIRPAMTAVASGLAPLALDLLPHISSEDAVVLGATD